MSLEKAHGLCNRAFLQHPHTGQCRQFRPRTNLHDSPAGGQLARNHASRPFLVRCYMRSDVSACSIAHAILTLRRTSEQELCIQTFHRTFRASNGNGAPKDVMDSLRSNVEQHKAAMKWARAIVVENK